MRKGLAIFAAVAVGTLLTAAFFYPGYLNGDSDWQYQQALGERPYSDWHPVVMAYTWSYLDALIEGSGGLFLLSAFTFWLGVALVLAPFVSGAAWLGIAVLWIGLYPPHFAMLSQLTKDTLMAGVTLLAFAALWRSHATRSRLAWYAALPLVWYSLALRHNGPAALSPLIVWMGFLLARDQLPARGALWLRSGVAAVALFALLIASHGLARTAILGEDGERTPAYQSLLVYDIVGVSARSGVSYVPLFYTRGREAPYSMEEIRAWYDPRSDFWIHFGVRAKRHIPFLQDVRAIEALPKVWWKAVSEQPLAYAAHRLEHFVAVLCLMDGTPVFTPHFNVEKHYHYVNPVMFGTAANRWFVDWITGPRQLPGGEREPRHPLGRGFANSYLFVLWPYLLVSALCMGWVLRRRSPLALPVWMLGLSSLAVIGPLLLGGLASNYRYVWYATLVAALQLAMLLLGPRRSLEETAGAGDGALDHARSEGDAEAVGGA